MRTHSDPALTLQTQNIFRLVRMAKGASENFGGTKRKFRKAKLTMGYAGDPARLGVHLTR
jgi:hypothetical protein